MGLTPEVEERMRPLWDACDTALRSDVGMVIDVAKAVNVYDGKRQAARVAADSRRANQDVRDGA